MRIMALCSYQMSMVNVEMPVTTLKLFSCETAACILCDSNVDCNLVTRVFNSENLRKINRVRTYLNPLPPIDRVTYRLYMGILRA